jgi:phytoene dehydrogenase-like protein
MARDFDLVVVGSSPLLLLFALQATKAGHSVCIVERKPQLGGAWSLDRCDLEGAEVMHENACHLIEWYAGGYELLESLSGMPFVPNDPQPIRVWRSGKVAPYTSRLGIAREYLLAWRTIAYSMIKLGLAGVRIRYTIPEAWYLLKRSLVQLRLETVHRLPGLLGYPGVCAPKDGFAAFVEALIDQAGAAGVVVRTSAVSGIARDGDGWRVTLYGGEALTCARVAVGQSTDIAALDGAAAKPNHHSDYHHVLVGLPAADTRVRSPYVHFPDHPLFHRITYVEDVVTGDGRAFAVFLLQLRVPLDKVADLGAELAEICRLYEIASNTAGLVVLKSMEAQHVSSAFDSGWRGNRGDGPIVLKTIGDLSRSALANRALLERWNGKH